MSLLPVANAQARLFALGAPLAKERVSLAEAFGRWSADEVTALRTQPAADLSAMDGYAICFADLPGPWRWAGESRAGAVMPTRLEAGTAMRIFTGAPVPPGADTILVQEEAAQDGDTVTLAGEGPPHQGAHIRRIGSDFTAGATLIRAGERLTPGRIAAAAIGGHGAIAVRRRPRIAIISTGDELVTPGAPAEGVMLPASNGIMLEAMIGGLAAVRNAGIVPDRLDLLTQAFRDADADIIVTSGGASVGDHDLVRPAMIAAGGTIDFWKIAMRPGKPLLAGRIGETLILGLPGNPVSAFVTAHLFLLPLIARLSGAADPLPAIEPALLNTPLPEVRDRTDYLRGHLADGRVSAISNQDSAALAALTRANALILRPAGAPAAAVNQSVDILRIA